MLKILSIFILFSTVYLAQAIQIPAIKFSPKKYMCYKTTEPIVVDGKLSEKAWSNTEWTDDFVDIEGSSKPIPRFRTRAKMLWDENYFYIAAEIKEPDIWAYLKNHDDIIFYDNDFEIFIDPDGNTHDYCEFEMNALNTVWELLLEKPYRDIDKAAKNSWDIKGLKTGVSLQGTLNNASDKDSSWTVEIAFPWYAFQEIANVNTPPSDKDLWRINFSRVEWKTKVEDNKYKKITNPATGKPLPEDNWVWSPQGVVNMHYPEMWGYVQFAKEVVGSDKVPFAIPGEESAKWYLRMIYYKEINYFGVNGRFTDDLRKLGIKDTTITGYKTPANIECTTNLFEASVKSEDGKMTVTIRNDGLTTISKSK